MGAIFKLQSWLTGGVVDRLLGEDCSDEYARIGDEADEPVVLVDNPSGPFLTLPASAV